MAGFLDEIKDMIKKIGVGVVRSPKI